MIPKLVRTLTSVLPIDENRGGGCTNCGECCRLPFTCSFLRTNSEGSSYCAIYRFRPLNCRKFPRTASQMKPVEKTCGFTFEE